MITVIGDGAHVRLFFFRSESERGRERGKKYHASRKKFMSYILASAHMCLDLCIPGVGRLSSKSNNNFFTMEKVGKKDENGAHQLSFKAFIFSRVLYRENVEKQASTKYGHLHFQNVRVTHLFSSFLLLCTEKNISFPDKISYI